jgi:hypothetical protein
MRQLEKTVTGPDGAKYALGSPIWFWDDGVHVGTFNRVGVKGEGTQVSLEDFVFHVDLAEHPKALRRLATLEITSYLVNSFPALHRIYYVFTHTTGDEDGITLANRRARFFSTMGAVLDSAAPRTGPSGNGHFALVASWRRNPGNVRAVEQALKAARLQRARELRAGGIWVSRLMKWGSRLLP